MIKDFEYVLKKFIPEKYLLKKRLNRAIKKNYEKELEIIKKFSDKSKDALDIGVYRGVYSFQLAKYFNFVHSFEPNPLLFPYLNKNLKKILNNIQLYNYALSDSNGDTKLKLPIRSESIFKNNIEELYQLGAASIHPKNKFNDFKEVIVRKKKLDDLKLVNNDRVFNSKIRKPNFIGNNVLLIFEPDYFFKNGTYWSYQNKNDPMLWVMDHQESIDIDTELDFNQAQLLYQLLYQSLYQKQP